MFTKSGDVECRALSLSALVLKGLAVWLGDQTATWQGEGAADWTLTRKAGWPLEPEEALGRGGQGAWGDLRGSSKENEGGERAWGRERERMNE